MGAHKAVVGTKPVEGRMLFLLQHPLRRRLLFLYVESDDPLSPKELADYVKAPLDAVACHVRVLRDHHAVELVETRPVRGAVEHFYAATGLVERGELPSYKLGAARRIDPADVEDFLARHRYEGRHEA